ncbi:MAG: methionine--tRNA ligase [Deltaproteobacteria bacterium]|nr:methionine--tRNA ligase [Deltaproteobacteria bacterium]
MKKIYFTTPIYYVNAEPHIGHAYTTIVADVLNRFYKLAGYQTFFLTGTDEHGDKVAQAARAAGETPQSYADRISDLFRALWPKLSITNDRFIRTTEEAHKRVVQLILQKVYDTGDIYFGEYGGHYCRGCERFLTEKELADGKCPDHGTEPEFIKEKNYFFRMSKYQQWLIEHIQNHPGFIRPERYRNEVLAFLRDPLEDLCISRPKSRLAWGIPLPFDAEYVTYVWFDALINYITGLDYPDGERFGQFWPVGQHLIAKDILKPHGIYWPTMLKSAGIPPYQRLNVHGYWIVSESKMSKSRGNIVKPLDLKDKYGLDAFRYFLLREMPFGLDSNFSEIALVGRINADLANDLGNLVSRTLAMAERFRQGEIPRARGLEEIDRELETAALCVTREAERLIGDLSFHKFLIAVWELINLANKYIDTLAPWSLAKDPAKAERLNTVLYQLLETLRFVSVLISPFMPQTALKIQDQLGIPDPSSQTMASLQQWEGLAPGGRVYKGEALFPRVEENLKGEEKEKMESAPLISMEEFQRMDLRVGKVLAAENIKKSDKLLKLRVDIGEERTVVAGIARSYKPEELVGKTIILVANLQPTKLMGVESQGMVLSADGAERFVVATFDQEAKIGSKVR